jgi:menaquinone-dependent protoporphyrinogen IX oxidase
MGKIAVLYKSKYGTTRQYAEWIAEETGGTLFALPKVRVSDLEGYDTIVIGGGIYAGSIQGMKFLTKNFAALASKRLIAFAVGSSIVTEKNTEEIRDKAFPPEMRNSLRFYKLRGGLDYPHMGFLDRTLMKMLVGMLRKKPEGEWDEETRGIIENYGKTVSFIDRAAIAPIARDVRT